MVCCSRVQPSLIREERRPDTKERRKSSLRKTVNTRENFWNVYCFIVLRPIRCKMKPQKNCQTTAWISHDLIQNNELAFSSNELAFLSQLIFKYQTTEFGIDLEVSVNCQNLQQYKFSNEGFLATRKYGSKTINHSQLAWPFELYMKRTLVSPASNWLVIFCSQTHCLFLSALSDRIYSIEHGFPVMSLAYHSYLFFAYK